MRCEELSDDLAAAADGSVLLGRIERRHVERFRREAVQHEPNWRRLPLAQGDRQMTQRGAMPERREESSHRWRRKTTT